MRRTFFSLAIAALAALVPAVALAGEAQDRAVAEQIAGVLRDSGKMQNYSVGIKYKDGTIWLSGRVSSVQQMQSALQVLSDIEGIDQIVNNLTIASGNSGVKQASATKNTGAAKSAPNRRVSAASPDMSGGEQGADGEATQAGYAHAYRHAALHGHPMPMYGPGAGPGGPPPAYDQANVPNWAWPSYAAYPNYAAVTYPKQYSPTAFPYIGPFYPYPQVPLGWRKVALEWDDGWWFLDFYDRNHH